MSETTTAGKPSAAPDLAPLTSIRGIAALGVVLYHFCGSFLPALDTSVSGLLEKGYLWVDMFFVLSGFIMAHAYTETFSNGADWATFRSFVVARFARIYPLHLVVLLGFVGLELSKWVLVNQQWGLDVDDPFGPGASPLGLVLNVLMLQTVGIQHDLTWNGPAWSIGAEFLVYLLFPLLTLLAVRLHVSVRWVWAIAICAGLWMISWGNGSLDQTTQSGVVRCALEFTLGMLAYRLYLLLHRPGWWISPLVACGWIGILLAFHLRAPDYVFPPMFAAMVVLLAADRGMLARLLSLPALVWLGSVSYAVYMTHFLVLRLINFLSRATTGLRIGDHLDRTESILFLVPVMLLVICTANLLYRTVEVPSRRMLRRTFAATGRAAT